jgi:hypothetical protein
MSSISARWLLSATRYFSIQDDISLGQYLGIGCVIQSELLIDLIAAYFAEVISLI